MKIKSPAASTSTKLRFFCLKKSCRLKFSSYFFLLLFLTSCQTAYSPLELPSLPYFPQSRQLQYLPSPFEKLSREELQEEWAKELYIGQAFGREMDLYRAITAFKRALFLLPMKRSVRRSQIEYCIFESYYLGRKYKEALEIFEGGTLLEVSASFPAYKELSIQLYECYCMTNQLDKACRVLDLLEVISPQSREPLEIWSSLINMDLEKVSELSSSQPYETALNTFIGEYQASSKSIQKARVYNALIPGLGYLYVGQKKTALTSFLINTLFTGAAYYFFKNRNIPAGVITASLKVVGI